MPWSEARPRGGQVNPKYRSKEHRDTRAQHMADLKRAGSGTCAEMFNPGSRCLYRSHTIVPAMPLDLCHNRWTGEIIGLGHRRCNRSEASRYARGLQNVTTLRW